MRVTVRIPLTGTWVATIRVPDDAINNIANFLDDNPEYLDDVQENGHLEGETFSHLDAQVEPD